MKHKFIQLLMILSIGIAPIHSALAKSTMSPVGTWTTIDDKTHKPRSQIRISNRNGKLQARIIKVYAKKSDTGFCKKCPGKLKNQPIKGLRFVWDLKPAGNLKWSGGKILDPKNGKIYRCKMSLSKSGKKLSVRGYIGISLFGRTQTWVR